MRKFILTAVAVLCAAPLAFGAGGYKKLEVIKESGGWLGITLMQSTASDADPGADSRVRVVSVIPDSPADDAGLQSGDVIFTIDGEPLEGVADLTAYLSQKRSGDAVALVVLRDGDEKSLEVILGERPSHSHLAQVLKLDTLDNILENNVLKFRDHHDLQEIKRGYLGVRIQELTPELRRFFGAEEDVGVLVAGVEEQSPAQIAGLEAGDVILEIDAQPIKSNLELQKAVRKMKKDDEVKLTILRRQKTMEIPVAVDERSAKKVSIFYAPDGEGELHFELPDLDLNVEDLNLPDLDFDVHKFDDGPFLLGEPGKKITIKTLCAGDDEDPDCEGSSFVWVHKGDQGEKLQELSRFLESDEFQSKLRALKEDRKTHEKQIKKLQKKIEELEKKLRKLER